MPVNERWILISNCQTHGLAHSMQMLADGVVVEPVDVGQYQAHVAHYNALFGSYDRVLVGACAHGVPGADFSLAPRLDKVPELAFTAYHPDLTYIMDGPRVVNGPVGAYHSTIAFVAHQSGYSLADTLRFFNGETYRTCGYLDRWAPARDHMIWYCSLFGLDVSRSIRNWGRHTAFMYGNNHPKIHVLYDIARLYLQREGHRVILSDFMPPDNLAISGMFAVYPEIGDALGVRGAYAFKRINGYSQIDLRQFVEESFALYDTFAPGQLEVHGEFRDSFNRVAPLFAADRRVA